MDIDDFLDEIKKKGLDAIKAEFKDLLQNAESDSSKFIRDSAARIKKALIYLAEGQLDRDDIATLLKKEKKLAQIEANVAQIQARVRIQKLIYRLIDIALDFLLKV